MGGPTSATGVTRLLEQVRDGDREALDRLLPLVYEELRGLARAQLGRGGGPRTLQATALVHEAYVKLVRSTDRGGGAGLDAENRAHFLSIAARAMRQVLVDRARAKGTEKRGGDWVPTTLHDGDATVEVDAAEMLALNEAIESLEPRQRQIVESRFFGGLEESEVASLLGVSERTVRRDWVKARAWLVRALMPEATEGDPS
ncbi:MAG: ECF-type sigma factor [Longimicrobiales bacterium]|nr:ECF-type sigma factor [Longimicrobiales bacterium]